MEKSTFTFWELINKWTIVIPQVQRDYAYGRDDAKAVAVSTGILKSIHDALMVTDSDSAPLALDFVYGSVREGIGMTPLDGQQRLTTLFLLHLFASIKDGKKEERLPLKRFYYQTRQSANTFCSHLIEQFDYHTDFEKEPLSAQIKANPKYIPAYDDDPTIVSMLVVLDRISTMFNDIPELWEKLTVGHRVIFYFLPLNRFGLSDDLFIKMNSRGKPLTRYELFKSDFEEFLEKHYPGFKERFSKSLDTVWTDMLWKVSGNDVSNVDNGFINLFHNISLLQYHLRTDTNFQEYGNEDVYLSLPFEKQFTSEEDVALLEDIFVKLQSLSVTQGFQDYWDRNFYTSDSAIEKSDNDVKIRLFWRQKEPLFVLAFRNKLTRAQLILFYALYLGLVKETPEEELMMKMRHLRNLITNSEFELRGKNLHGMLVQTGEYISNNTLPTGFFNANQISEESIKQTQMSEEEWKGLWRYENHFILKGSLLLFINTKRVDLLGKFETLFNDDYIVNTNTLRRCLLAVSDDVDYMQFEPYMETDTFKRRMFVNRWDYWPAFFTWNNRRRNQESIIECLSKLPDSLDKLPQLLDDCIAKLSTKSWKYYMIKYPDDRQTNIPWSQGIYHWDDMENKPLEVIMLNSSQHGIYNLEWNILNSTLRHQDAERFSLDDHNHVEVRLTRANSALDGNQKGWTVSTYEPDYLLDGLRSLLNSEGEKKYSMDENTVIVPEGVDYISFGLQLTTDIEALYSEHHANDPILEEPESKELPEQS